MRILHTSDWHLGRLFHQVHLTDDQAHVLEQLHAMAKELKPDVIVVAGDLYDRAVPPAEAVELLDETLTRLILDLGIPTIAIAGNHDSAERVGFGNRMLAERGLHLAGTVGDSRCVTLGDADGPVDFVPIPYASPDAVRSYLHQEELRGHQAALAAQVESARAAITPGRRSVAIAHAFVVGGAESGSERSLSVGGTGAVEASVFAGFDYVALGHLHRPQRVREERVRYSGSLLQYSFSEVDHDKSVSLIELDGAGAVSVETFPLVARRRLRIVEGTFDDIMRDAANDAAPQDYLLVRLTDRGLVMDAMPRLRSVYPHVLHLERTMFQATGDQLLPAGADHRTMQPINLFATFFEQVTGGSITEPERAEVVSVLEAFAGTEGGAA